MAVLSSCGHADRNYWIGAGRQDKFVPYPYRCACGIEVTARTSACGYRARAGCAPAEAGGALQAEETDLRDGRIRGHRRIAEGSRERFGVACAPARSECTNARGPRVREFLRAPSERKY